MKPVVISELTLWLLQVAIILVVIGLARQVWLLHLRLPARGSGPLDGGPAVGSTVEVPEVMSLKSRPVAVLAPGRITLVLFANSGCSFCSPILEALRRLMRVDPEIAVTVAVDGEASDALSYLSKHGFGDGVPAVSLSQIDPGDRPIAMALSAEGRVLAAGVPNTLEQLEVLVADARRTRVSMTMAPTDAELLPIADGDMSE